MGLSLTKTVIGFLKEHPEKSFTARDIAEWIFKTYPKECQDKQKRSTAKVNPIITQGDLVQQITAEIGSQRPAMQKKEPNIKTTEGKPRKYYYSENTDFSPFTIHGFAGDADHSIKITEHEFYNPLIEYFKTELCLYSKRINEKYSSNKKGPNGNKWLYPDIVSVENLGAEWHDEIKECASHAGDSQIKLWSFEVKLGLNRSNVRESFFQAVSNSSWANFGYLVAGGIQGDDTLKELRILSGLHGIGVILFNFENPSESEIIIQAKERSNIDWHTANRIAQANSDFLEYITLIHEFHKIGKFKENDWDGR